MIHACTAGLQDFCVYVHARLVACSACVVMFSLVFAVCAFWLIFAVHDKVALDRAAHLMDAVAFGHKDWDGVREELAEVFCVDLFGPFFLISTSSK